MCSLVGWAGNVSESVRFRIKINTILAEDHFGVFPEPGMRGIGTENGSPSQPKAYPAINMEGGPQPAESLSGH